MKKTKKIVMAIIIITLIALGIYGVVMANGYQNSYWYDDKRGELPQSSIAFQKNIELGANAMVYEYSNLYCIELGNDLANSGEYYDCNYAVRIEGKKATFYKGGLDESHKLGEHEHISNNILAAILTPENMLPSGVSRTGSDWWPVYTHGFQLISQDSARSYCKAQIGVFNYIDTWYNNSGATMFGVPMLHKNVTVGGMSNTKNKPPIKEGEELANLYDFCVIIYFLEFNEGEGNNHQNLIAVYPTQPTNEPETTEVKVTKKWNDSNNAYNTRPGAITVKLLANDQPTDKVLELNALNALNDPNKWEGKFTELPLNDDYGNKITYTVEEVNPGGYYQEPITGDASTGFTITNTLKTKITVVKEWNDQENLDELRPSSVKVTLYSNGNSTKVTRTLSASNNWKETYDDLKKYDEKGNVINYTVVEDVVPNYETPEYTTTEDEKGNVTITIKNTHKPNYVGYTEITGKVWLDGKAGKDNSINGKLDSNEAGLSGIKVTLKDANGNQFDATSTTTTDSKGNYTIKVNYDNSQNVYKLYENENTVKTKLETAYVEFEYDGQKYTTVKTGTTGADTSKAKENETQRNSLDSAHSTVTSTTPIASQWTDKNITAITKDVISFKTYADKTGPTKREEVIKYCNGNGTYKHTNPNNAWESITTGTHTCANCNKKGHSMRTFEVDVTTIQNVNLGLFEREQPDVAIFSDLTKVEVTMNQQKYTYLYGVRSEESKNVGLQVKFQNKDTYTYRRPVNPADIAYIQEEANKNEMSVLVTYEVKVANLSSTLPVTVHNIINSYDSKYTLNTQGWTVNAGTGFNQATSGELNITVNPLTESSAIELTYTVSVDAIIGLLKEEATLNNAVEIGSYSTTYGTDTLYAEQRTGERAGKPYGGYDYNSHPGNAGIYINNEGRLQAAKAEDDTDVAPSFVLCKDGETKVLSGNVWEDTDTDNGSGPENFRLGDGKKAEGEKNIANVKIELYKLKANEDGSISKELANLYKIEDNGTISTKPAIVYSDANGNYSLGNSEGYSVVTDTYVIKFTYGEGITTETGTITSTIDSANVDARNYKSTIIAEGTEVYNVFKGTSSSEEWHLNLEKGYSIAVDDMNQRVAIEDLKHSNFDEAINIVAESKPFKMQVEFDPNEEKTSQVGEDGKTTYSNELNVFDFGIIERAQEDIFVEKTITNFKITLANGQVLTEGNPREDKDINYVKALGFSQDINSGEEARKAFEKQLLVEMDAELIQGAQLDVKYEIKVTNNSEKDYDYYVDNVIKTEYYYFGTNDIDKSPLITSSVNYLVDYADADIEYTWEDESKWERVTSTELGVETQELVSATTLEAINTDKYIVYATKQFSELAPGETATDYANARRLLANSDENVFENHIEILEIDAKTARTIKEYIPGNYEPGTSETEQDDDRVNIIITPPTGETKYIITYVIAGLAGLIVMVAGIVFIKKKVLTK